jgi:hypothetical protein
MNVHEVFSQQEINAYVKDGYSLSDIQEALNNTVNDEKRKALGSTPSSPSPTSTASNSMFSGAYSENLIKYQLELDGLLERIEHLLRGDVMSVKNSNIIWTRQTDKKKIIFNEDGVGEIMRILAMYLNINTILSNYDEKTINDKCFDLGNELKDLIYMKYKVFGLDSHEKRKLYPIIVREVIDVVHSAYLRALNGGERNSLREGRQVTQADNPNAYPGGININTNRERGIFNPMRFFKGKHI